MIHTAQHHLCELQLFKNRIGRDFGCTVSQHRLLCFALGTSLTALPRRSRVTLLLSMRHRIERRLFDRRREGFRDGDRRSMRLHTTQRTSARDICRSVENAPIIAVPHGDIAVSIGSANLWHGVQFQCDRQPKRRRQDARQANLPRGARMSHSSNATTSPRRWDFTNAGRAG